jgi:hypothetical protein
MEPYTLIEKKPGTKTRRREKEINRMKRRIGH